MQERDDHMSDARRIVDEGPMATSLQDDYFSIWKDLALSLGERHR